MRKIELRAPAPHALEKKIMFMPSAPESCDILEDSAREPVRTKKPGPGVDRPVFLDENSLHLAGNPAVIAPRFRPVALRPRLSAGLPESAPRQYAQ